MHPAHRAEAPFHCPSAGYVNPAARAAWTEGSPRPRPDGAPLWTAGSGDVTGESPCPVTAAGQPEAHRGRYQNRAAVFCRGLTRLRAPDRGSGKHRRRRRGWPIGGWGLRRTAAAPLAQRTRPAPRSAPLSPEPGPRLHGAARAAHPPPTHGRGRRSAVRLHPSRHGPGDTSRPSPASGASLDGSAREAGGPGPGPGGTRSRVAWGL